MGTIAFVRFNWNQIMSATPSIGKNIYVSNYRDNTYLIDNAWTRLPRSTGVHAHYAPMYTDCTVNCVYITNYVAHITNMFYLSTRCLWCKTGNIFLHTLSYWLTGVFGGALVVEVRGDDLLLRGGARAVGRGDGGGARLGVPRDSIDIVDIVDLVNM